MGFLNQFKQQQQQGSSLNDIVSQAQSIAMQGGGADAVIKQLADNGAMCTMPSGKQIAVSEIVSMSKTMPLSQLLSQLMQA